jgi:hypothetical protein
MLKAENEQVVDKIKKGDVETGETKRSLDEVARIVFKAPSLKEASKKIKLCKTAEFLQISDIRN